jgi:hypothetical protein
LKRFTFPDLGLSYRSLLSQIWLKTGEAPMWTPSYSDLCGTCYYLKHCEIPVEFRGYTCKHYIPECCVIDGEGEK